MQSIYHLQYQQQNPTFLDVFSTLKASPYKNASGYPIHAYFNTMQSSMLVFILVLYSRSNCSGLEMKVCFSLLQS